MNTTTTTIRPYLAFYHANAKGTGCASKFELHPAHGGVEGYVSVLMANQRTGDPNANPQIYPSFNWQNGIIFTLTFTDLCEFMRVFRGEAESIQDGKGLYIRTSEFSMRVSLRHMVEPIDAYCLEAHRTAVRVDGEEDTARILLSSTEAMGLCLAFENSMSLIAFGIPKAD